MADDPEARAILDLLAADTDLVSFDGHVPDGIEPPYVQVYFTAGQRIGDELTMRSTARRLRVYCHCVGHTAATARVVAGRVQAALLDAVPVIPGRVVAPIRSEAANQPPRRDESTGRLVMDLVEVYVLDTTRIN